MRAVNVTGRQSAGSIRNTERLRTVRGIPSDRLRACIFVPPDPPMDVTKRHRTLRTQVNITFGACSLEAKSVESSSGSASDPSSQIADRHGGAQAEEDCAQRTEPTVARRAARDALPDSRGDENQADQQHCGRAQNGMPSRADQ